MEEQKQEKENIVESASIQDKVGTLQFFYDVELIISVELGRVECTLDKLIKLRKGSIIELNKLAGEAIDVLVNGKYVAKGEVVVIEDSFGIRLTEIVR